MFLVFLMNAFENKQGSNEELEAVDDNGLMYAD